MVSRIVQRILISVIIDVKTLTTSLSPTYWLAQDTEPFQIMSTHLSLYENNKKNQEYAYQGICNNEYL